MLAIFSLVACHHGDGDPLIDPEFAVSSGAIAGVEITTTAILNNLPVLVKAAVSNVIDTNEMSTETVNMTSGAADFLSTFALTTDTDDRGKISGNVNMDVDFDELLIAGTFSPTAAFENNSNALTIDRNLEVGGEIDGSVISAALTGPLDVNGEIYAINGILRGKFAGDPAASALGTIGGDVQYPDRSFDGLLGYFETTKQ